MKNHVIISLYGPACVGEHVFWIEQCAGHGYRIIMELIMEIETNAFSLTQVGWLGSISSFIQYHGNLCTSHELPKYTLHIHTH